MQLRSFLVLLSVAESRLLERAVQQVRSSLSSNPPLTSQCLLFQEQSHMASVKPPHGVCTSPSSSSSLSPPLSAVPSPTSTFHLSHPPHLSFLFFLFFCHSSPCLHTHPLSFYHAPIPPFTLWLSFQTDFIPKYLQTYIQTLPIIFCLLKVQVCYVKRVQIELPAAVICHHLVNSRTPHLLALATWNTICVY